MRKEEEEDAAYICLPSSEQRTVPKRPLMRNNDNGRTAANPAVRGACDDGTELLHNRKSIKVWISHIDIVESR